jgi:hypothetical protein
MALRQNRVQLTIKERDEILEMIDRGVTSDIIAKMYGIGRSTVRDIIASEEKIKNYLEPNTVVARCSPNHLIKIPHMNFERILYLWYILCKAKRIQITGSLIRKKALEWNKKLNGDPNFKTSSNWLLLFKELYRTRGRSVTVNIRTSKKNAANNSKARFEKFLQDEGFTLENVYNIDDRELIWRTVPEHTWIFRNENSIVRLKLYELHITVLLCEDITDCHKWSVGVNRFMSPRSSYNLNTNLFPIIYTDNTNASMNIYD